MRGGGSAGGRWRGGEGWRKSREGGVNNKEVEDTGAKLRVE
jgi:hypothetical protein